MVFMARIRLEDHQVEEEQVRLIIAQMTLLVVDNIYLHKVEEMQLKFQGE